MKDYKIIIVGFGVVGKLEYDTLYEKFFPDFLDVNGSMLFSLFSSGDNKLITFEEAIEKIKDVKYDLAIVAVPTPFDEKAGVLDCHLVYDAVKEVNADIYLIKSTTNVGYCDYLAEVTHKHIVHSPEYSGATQHCNNFDFNFTILGGDDADCQVVQEIYQEVFDARHEFIYYTRRESEAIKLVENSYLPNTVSFWNSIWESCNNLGICFEKVREGVLKDPRIPREHSAVYPSHPYWDSHCFNKDERAFANQSNNDYLKHTYEFNEKMKMKYKK